ncbi:hypothetical protein LTR16_005734, partial [Cryomyces antarcticus]
MHPQLYPHPRSKHDAHHVPHANDPYARASLAKTRTHALGSHACLPPQRPGTPPSSNETGRNSQVAAVLAEAAAVARAATADTDGSFFTGSAHPGARGDAPRVGAL